MRLSGLASRLRALGFEVVEHSGASTRGYKARDLSAVRGVVWHHTGTPIRSGQSDYPTANYIMGGGAYAPWAQLGIGRTGIVHHLASGLANHAGKGSYPGLTGNSDTIGVEVETNGTASAVTDAQRATIARLARALTVIYGVPPATHHIRHGDWATPRGRKNDIVGVTTSGIRTAAADPATLGNSAPPPKPPEDDMANVTDAQLAALLEGARDAALARELALQARDVAVVARDVAAGARDVAVAARDAARLAADEARKSKDGVGRLEAGGVGDQVWTRQLRDEADPSATPRLAPASRHLQLARADANGAAARAAQLLARPEHTGVDVDALAERFTAALATRPGASEGGLVRADVEAAMRAVLINGTAT